MTMMMSIGVNLRCGWRVSAECDAAAGCWGRQRRRQPARQTAAKCPPLDRLEAGPQRLAFQAGDEPVRIAGVGQTRSEAGRRRAGGVGFIGPGRRYGGGGRSRRGDDPAGLEAAAGAMAGNDRLDPGRLAARRQVVDSEQRRRQRRPVFRRPWTATAADVARVRDGRREARAASMLCHHLAAVTSWSSDRPAFNATHYAVLVSSSVITVRASARSVRVLVRRPKTWRPVYEISHDNLAIILR